VDEIVRFPCSGNSKIARVWKLIIRLFYDDLKQCAIQLRTIHGRGSC